MNAINYLLSFLRAVPIVDVGLGVFVFVRTRCMWKDAGTSEENSPQERQLGLSAIQGELTAIVTAGTILLIGSGAITTLGTKLNEAARLHLLWAAVWTLMSLGVALWALATLPSQVSKHNLVKSKTTALLSVVALYLFFVAAVRMGFAFWHRLFGVAPAN